MLLQVASMLGHIDGGCVSDPVGVTLYRSTGRLRCGVEERYCARGTSPLEGYHLHARKVNGAASRFSPRVANRALMEFNFRWNFDRGIQRLGKSDSLTGMYDVQLIELIQALSVAIWPDRPPVYSDWIATHIFKDTGERAGLIASMFDQHGAG